MITEQCPTAITVLILQNIVGLIINAVMLGKTPGKKSSAELCWWFWSTDVRFSLCRLHLHEDSSVEPSSRDVDLQPARCDRSQKQQFVFYDTYWRSQEEHDHRSDRQVTGVLLLLYCYELVKIDFLNTSPILILSLHRPPVTVVKQVVRKTTTPEGEVIPIHQIDIQTESAVASNSLFLLAPLIICHVIDKNRYKDTDGLL